MASVKHTYGSRKRRVPDARPPLSSPSSSSPPATPPITRPSKRPFSDLFTNENQNPSLFHPSKRLKSTSKPTVSATTKTKSKANTNSKATRKQKTLTQLHFNIDQTILRTCSLCDFSYIKGTPDDERLHRAHCARVRQGMEWGRDEERDRLNDGRRIVVEVESNIKLKNSKKVGRIISFPADIGGKIGTKLATFLHTINLSLSAPALPDSALQSSKAYFFLLQNESQSRREHIVGCVIAQRITTAMAIIPSSLTDDNPPLNATQLLTPIIVDTTTNLSCSPIPLPTPMGISRLFVSLSHRRLGIAHSLLDAAAATFIHGCPLDPKKGHIAFSQPTGIGQAVMAHWGCTKVYEE